MKEIKTIKRSSRFGLWGSVALVILSAAFIYVSPWQFRQNPQVSQWMLIAGSVLAVLSLSMALLVIRRQIPRLRQLDTLQEKLTGYAAHIRSLYLSIFCITLMLCLLMLLSNQNVLLMLTMVVVLTLFLAYPNIYRIKVDLGLTDDEMKTLFSDQYISGNDDRQ